MGNLAPPDSATRHKTSWTINATLTEEMWCQEKFVQIKAKQLDMYCTNRMLSTAWEETPTREHTETKYLIPWEKIHEPRAL